MMKKYSLSTHFVVLLFLGCSVLFSSCNEQDLIGEAIYPDQNIYMSQAAVATVGPGANGIYTITPRVEGFVTRYVIDVPTSKFNVPLGVIRSGVNLAGEVNVSILTNTDTITKLIALQKFAVAADPLVVTEILPTSAFALPGSVTVKDGTTNADFILPIDLNFLTTSLASNPKKRYVIGVSINPGKADNAKIVPLRTTVILIDPSQVLLAVANFSSAVFNDIKTANFINSTANGVTYSWNYGDGTPVETTVSPSHKYASAGTYMVTLTATGVAGPPSVKTISVVIP